jgi:hypothetical protein
MATRTVRLDDEAEAALRSVQRETGLPISEVLKRGLRSLNEQVRRQADRTAYSIYAELDLGPGGYASAPSSAAKRAARDAIRRKHRR